MITNFERGLKYYCTCHGEPIEMVQQEGSSTFLACPKFFVRDDKHPDGREQEEPPCYNRISYYDADKIIEKYMATIERMTLTGATLDSDFAGITVKYKEHEAKLLKCNFFTKKVGLKKIR